MVTGSRKKRFLQKSLRKKGKWGLNKIHTNGLSYPKQTILTKQPIKREMPLLDILDTDVEFYPKFSSYKSVTLLHHRP